jgi:release factor glutamine methyltransferase
LIDAVLHHRTEREAPLSILDLGTGTGCLLLALLSEYPKAAGLGIDRSVDAVKLAASNAERLGLAGRARFQTGDWGADLSQRFDLVISNPPYIPCSEIDGLEPEVAGFEPRLALDGGPDGLKAYRAIAAQLPGLLAPGGLAVLEVGAGQSGQVATLLAGQGLANIEIRADLGGIPRAVLAEKRK